MCSIEKNELNTSIDDVQLSISRLNNLYASLNETLRKNDVKQSNGPLKNNKTIKTESHFTNVTDSTKYMSLGNIEKETNIAMESSISSTDLNSTEDLFDDIKGVPLPVLVRRMLDKAFGKSIDSAGVNKNRCNLESNNNEINSSHKNINSNSEVNDRTSLHESHEDDTRPKDDKLNTIEEENSNSLHHTDIIERTGRYLSELFKFDDKLIDPVKHDNPLLLRNDIEVFPSQVDVNIQADESLCHTIIVEDESLIHEEKNDDKNESVIIINTIDSSNDVDLSSNYEQTADFLNFSKGRNSVPMKQVLNESLRSSDKTSSSPDSSLKDIDCSTKEKPKFISTFTLNLRRSYKRHRQSITLIRHALVKRTPKLSLKTNGKPDKTPGRDITRSHNTPKQKITLPEIIVVPATPKQISSS